jgi:penicillin-binding protein 2
MSMTTIANDGVQMRPTLLREIVDGEGNVIQSFHPEIRWDLTKDPLIEKYENPSGIGACKPTGEKVTVQPWVIETVQEGMRGAVQFGTLAEEFADFPIAAAGKTGTAEYCDEVAFAKGRCVYGNWPSHAWTMAYAPYDDPEIAVIAFVYNGQEGATVAAPIVRQVLDAYFEIKAIDTETGNQ